VSSHGSRTRPWIANGLVDWTRLLSTGGGGRALRGSFHARGCGFFEGADLSERHGDDFRARGHVCFEGTVVCELRGANFAARGRAGERPSFARNASLGPSVIPGAKDVADGVANELRGATNVDDSVPDEARGTANVGEMATNQPARVKSLADSGRSEARSAGNVAHSVPTEARLVDNELHSPRPRLTRSRRKLARSIASFISFRP
jgi:hypothetical protein